MTSTNKKLTKKQVNDKKRAEAKRKAMTMKALNLMGKMQGDPDFNSKLKATLAAEQAKDPKGFERGAKIISHVLGSLFDEYDAPQDLRSWVQTNLRAHAEVKS